MDIQMLLYLKQEWHNLQQNYNTTYLKQEWHNAPNDCLCKQHFKNNLQGHYTLHSNAHLLKQEWHNIQQNYNTIFLSSSDIMHWMIASVNNTLPNY